MRVAFFEVEKWEKDRFRARLRDVEPVFFADTVQEVDRGSIEDVEGICVFIYSSLTREVIAALPRLRLIATRSTGFDHIDLEACKKRSVTVTNVPYYGENTVAEHTFGLILSLSRNIHKAHMRTVRQDFSLEDLQGFDLKGKTIGVIGAGRIGLHVIRIARGFGMEALAYDVKRDRFIAEILGFRYVPLDELLASSDVISLHAPYNESTHHIINRDTLSKVKRGALLVNTARGALVDTAALLWALDEGILRGAGLDVLEGEELMMEEGYVLRKEYSADVLRTFVRNQMLLRREDVVVTPHNAFNSKEAAMRILETTVENIEKFIEGRPQNVVV
ncbi:MAG: hydroxyacid dehydrogenase [Firmicutes bacterium]|jgi:D-lactate dehydrogenase|nr:hydroxyacid dehydrogenase [Bacillota bacterium]MDH7495926.1 hydroxyacid dehydrogenase [Bacillota bacterium]